MVRDFQTSIRAEGDRAAKGFLLMGIALAAGCAALTLVLVATLLALDGQLNLTNLIATTRDLWLMVSLVGLTYAIVALYTVLGTRGCGAQQIARFGECARELISTTAVYASHSAAGILSDLDRSNAIRIRVLSVLGEWIPRHLPSRTTIFRSPNLAGFVPHLE